MTGSRIVILANGTWGSDVAARAAVDGADIVLATDGAWDKARSAGIRVHEVIGDFDSAHADPSTPESGDGPAFEVHPTAKDATDLELALQRAFVLDAARIAIYGAAGGRLDHTLCNLHLLEQGLDRRIPVTLVTDTEHVRVIDGFFRLDAAQSGDRVSLIPLSATARVTTGGLRYPLRNERLYRASSRGISNDVAEIPAFVDVHDGTLLLVHTFGGAQ